MNQTTSFINSIHDLIGKNQMKDAIQQMQSLLTGSPLFDELILQSSRFNDVMYSIRKGTINTEDANLEKNKIRYALIDMVRELEEQADANIQSEVEAFLSQQTPKTNTSTITGDGNINLQDLSGSSINIQINTPNKADQENHS